jgi:hypothetical protein
MRPAFRYWEDGDRDPTDEYRERASVLDSYPEVLAARTAKQQQQKPDRMIDLVARCRLPRRTKRRSYPREVWGRGYRFPIKRREKN